MSAAVFQLTDQQVRLVQESMFAEGVPAEARTVLRWMAPGAETYLQAYRRRDYKTELVPRLDRSLYALEYHCNEGSCCTRHPVIHDSPRSFMISYDDVALGLMGFDVRQDGPEPAVVVRQIQGTRYRTRHSDRDTGAEGPAKSVSWQPALLNLIVAFAPLAGASVVEVLTHRGNKYRKVANNFFGNAHRLYDGTAEACGFTYDAEREVWHARAGGNGAREARP